MFALITSALYGVLGFVFRSIIVKFVIFFALLFVVQEFIPVMVSWLPVDVNLKSFFDMLPDSAWYFIELFKLPLGIQLVINALIARFMVRRIPLIG